MTQFHEGQEVEVWKQPREDYQQPCWRKAKIAWQTTSCAPGNPKCYEVEFPNSTRAVFDADRIRAVETAQSGDQCQD